MFPEDVYTYVEGTRLDAATTDISAGGAFFQTTDPLRMGSLVAVVFKRQSETEDAVFLVGRVVRMRTSAPAGVGLRWTKAVTEAAPAKLAWFLTSVLGVDEPAVTQQRERGRWEMLSVHIFPEPESDAPGPGSDSLAASLAEAAEFSLEEPPPTATQSPEDGSLTTRIARSGLRAPAGLDATVILGDRTAAGLITHLGATSLYVQTEIMPAEKSGLLVVSFDVLTKNREVRVVCECRETARDDGASTGAPGLDLEIVRLEEEEAGLLRKYVRWLHFQALARE